MIALGGALLALLLICGFLVVRVAELSARSREIERLAQKGADIEEATRLIQEVREELAAIERDERKIRSWLGMPADSAAAARDGAGLESAGAATSSGDVDVADPSDDSPLEAVLVPRASQRPISSLETARLARSRPMIWPVSGWVSSGFDERLAGDPHHTGLDIAARPGVPVVAAAAGEVVTAGEDPQYGRVIVLDHGDGIKTLYAHNSRLSVRAGTRVKQGAVIAAVGSTGRSTAPHLHFEVRHGERALDPREFLPPEKQTPIAASTRPSLGAQ